MTGQKACAEVEARQIRAAARVLRQGLPPGVAGRSRWACRSLLGLAVTGLLIAQSQPAWGETALPLCGDYCHCQELDYPIYPPDGATGLSRWTPVIGSNRYLTVRDSAGNEAGYDIGSLCGLVVSLTKPLKANETYSIEGPFDPAYAHINPEYTIHFTTGESTEVPELLVEIGEDTDPGDYFVASLWTNLPLVAIHRHEFDYTSGPDPWTPEEYVSITTEPTDTIRCDVDELELIFVGREGQRVELTGKNKIQCRPRQKPQEETDQPEEASGGCSTGGVKGRGAHWALLGAFGTLLAFRRRRGAAGEARTRKGTSL